MRTTPEWLNDAILDGLSALLCLSLERTPATDLIGGTAAMWSRALADLDWDRQRDLPRVTAAFDTLAATRTTWPAPTHFRDALPKVEQTAIGYEVKPTPPEEAARILARLRAEVEGAPVLESIDTMPTNTPRTVLDAAEAELHRHYDRKTAAAGGDA